MSSTEDEGLNIDLGSLFQPEWAKGPADTGRYANYTGKEEVSGGRPWQPAALTEAPHPHDLAKLGACP